MCKVLIIECKLCQIFNLVRIHFIFLHFTSKTTDIYLTIIRCPKILLLILITDIHNIWKLNWKNNRPTC